jgi:5,5'-dehydrodivanillate O-demethylase
MLSSELNEKLTRVGPGTPMGRLMRMYWQPVAATAELAQYPVKPVKLLGESLVLFRDAQGRLGLIEDRCAHRLVDLRFGYPVDEGLRCPYHGWTYDTCGQCVAQPAESPTSTFKDKIKLQAYPVQELAGLIFAYLGPEPAPLLPGWEPLVREDLVREIYFSEIPCNWMQCMENSPDLTHVEWLHGEFARWALAQRGARSDGTPRSGAIALRHHLETVTEPFEYGLIRRRLLEGMTREDDAWKVGMPVVLPNMNMISQSGAMTFIWRTPLDDTHTMQWDIQCFLPPEGESTDGEIPCFEIRLKDEQGAWNLQQIRVQDHLVCVAQGDMVDRSRERLGASDEGVIVIRQALLEQLDILERGDEPINVFRDAAVANSIALPVIGRASPRRGSPYSRPPEGLVKIG